MFSFFSLQRKKWSVVEIIFYQIFIIGYCIFLDVSFIVRIPYIILQLTLKMLSLIFAFYPLCSSIAWHGENL